MLHAILKLAKNVRYQFLKGLYRIVAGEYIWNEDTRKQYENIFLKFHISVVDREGELLDSTSSISSYWLHKLYFAFPNVRKEDGRHIDVSASVTMVIHSLFGPLSRNFNDPVDNLLFSRYESLRHYLCTEARNEEHDEDGKPVPVIFRFARSFPTICNVEEPIFEGITRPVDVMNESDFSMLYYDVLQGKRSALVDEEAKGKVKNGEIPVIAISYRHKKDRREKLGISKRELRSAFSTFYNAAESSGVGSVFCIWWDSCLKCREPSRRSISNWAGIGLSPYAFCHVLSIRRSDEDELERFWIDLERTLARLSRGFTAVDITHAEERCLNGILLGMGIGPMGDPEYSLTQTLKYISSGDLHHSKVTFQADKDFLEYISLKLLCSPVGIAHYTALYGEAGYRIESFASYVTLEHQLFHSVLEIRLGSSIVLEGEGSEFIDYPTEIEGSAKKFWDLRRSWLPNSNIYKYVADTTELPYYVEGQAVLLVHLKTRVPSSTIGVLLYHEEETEYNAEAVHVCVTRFCSTTENSLESNDVARGHIPACSSILQDFILLFNYAKDNVGNTGSYQSMQICIRAIEWLWKESDMSAEVNITEVTCLSNTPHQKIPVKHFLSSSL